MSLPKGLNFNTAVIAGACIFGAWPLIKVMAYVQDQPRRDEQVVVELRHIRKELENNAHLMDKRITVLENRVNALESRP